MNLELATFLKKALEEIPGETDLIFVNTVVRDGARKNDTRPAFISHWVPDEWTLNIFGNPNLRDMYLAVRLPIEFVQGLQKKWKEAEKAKEGEDPSPPTPNQVDQAGDSAKSP